MDNEETEISEAYHQGWIDREEQLRELLSYLKTEAEKFDPDQQHDEFNPYDDAAYKLAEILDGEQ